MHLFALVYSIQIAASVACLATLWSPIRALVQLRAVRLRLSKGTSASDVDAALAKSRWSSTYDEEVARWFAGVGEGGQGLEPMGEVFRPGELYDAAMLGAVPGLLTGMGILGTFVGLALGVSTIVVSSPDALMPGIQQLISGLSVAAGTSIIGIALALVYTPVARWMTASIRTRCAELNDVLYRTHPNESVGEFLRRQRVAMESVRSNLESFQSDFISKLADALYERQRHDQTQFHEGLSESVSAGVQGAVSELQEVLAASERSMVGLVQSSTELVARLQGAGEEQARLAKELAGVTSGLVYINPMMTNLLREAKALSDTAVGGLKGVADSMVTAAGALGGSGKVLESHAARLEQHAAGTHAAMSELQNALAKLGELRNTLDSSIGRFATQTEGRLRETFVTFDKQLAEVASKLVTVTGSLLDNLDNLPKETQRIVAALRQTAEHIAAASRVQTGTPERSGAHTLVGASSLPPSGK